MSQVLDVILQHFQRGGTLTKITAIQPPFSTTSLLDKIFRLRKDGYDIKRRWCKNENTGARWAEFYMDAPRRDQ
jgi:hypothetical protein